MLCYAFAEDGVCSPDTLTDLNIELFYTYNYVLYMFVHLFAYMYICTHSRLKHGGLSYVDTKQDGGFTF